MLVECVEDLACGTYDRAPERRARGDASTCAGEGTGAGAITHQALNLIDLAMLFAMALVLRADAPELTLWTRAMLARVTAAAPPSAPWLISAIVAAQGALVMIPLALAALIVAGLSVHVTRRRGPLAVRHLNWSRLSGYSLRIRDVLSAPRTHQR
ncbi:MAG: hypothetical protein ACREQN_17165 [Candidatus Binataceae bacterium]